MTTNTTPVMDATSRKFSAILQKVPGMDAAYFCIPYDPVAEYGKKNQIKVKATINGLLYRGSIVDMGHGPMLGVTQEIRKKIGKGPGDTIEVTLEPDLVERTVEIPEDLGKSFTRHPIAAKFFNELSYTNRKEYVRWITEAKKTTTRTLRLEKTIEKLLAKMRNPSEH